jgi:hypothetical protein
MPQEKRYLTRKYVRIAWQIIINTEKVANVDENKKLNKSVT